MREEFNVLFEEEDDSKSTKKGGVAAEMYEELKVPLFLMHCKIYVQLNSVMSHRITCYAELS